MGIEAPPDISIFREEVLIPENRGHSYQGRPACDSARRRSSQRIDAHRVGSVKD
jgi:sRNA-binding carbon storage regulator CsrA